MITFSEHQRSLGIISKAFERKDSGIIVYYGEAGLGKTSLLREVADKYEDSIYYMAVPASSRQQASFMAEKCLQNNNLGEFPTYSQVFSEIGKTTKGKRILIFDEFDTLLKADDSFMEEIMKMASGEYSKFPFLFIFCTSSLSFVSGTMSKKMGKAALLIKGLIKAKEFSYSEMLTLCEGRSRNDVFYRYALLGGRPFSILGSLKYETIRDVIENMFLMNDGFYYDYGIRYIEEQLREPGVYSTILYLIAKGNNKLNDLFALSGFSRAKISVYLKNLIELDLVEKVYSYGAQARDDSLKGVYRISNPMMFFWYRFVYERRSDLEILGAEKFFDTYIEKDLSAYLEYYYGKIAGSLIGEEKINGIVEIKRCEEWVGKSGAIPVVAVPVGNAGKRGTGTICCFTKRALPVSNEDIDEIKEILLKASLSPKEVVIFTEAGSNVTGGAILGSNLCIQSLFSSF